MKCSICKYEIGLFSITLNGQQFCSNKCLMEKYPEYSRSEMEQVHDLKDKFEKEINEKRGELNG